MKKNILGLIVISIYIVFVFITSRLFKNKGKEICRKYIHIMLSNIWFMVICFFDDWKIAAILPGLFIIINILSYKFNIIKVMERDDNKSSLGTIYYAFILFILAIVTVSMKQAILALPGVLIMGYGDGLAAVIGKTIKSKEVRILGDKKTFAGSTTMFIVSMIISLITFYIIGMDYFIIKALITALIATILEAISIKGLDNITVPGVVTILVFCFI